LAYALKVVFTGHVHQCRVAGNTVWSHMAGDALKLCDGFPTKSYTPLYGRAYCKRMRDAFQPSRFTKM